MTAPTRAKSSEKSAEKAVDNASRLQVGDAVLLPDGGEAILVGIDGEEALLRVGTLHGAPVRRPLSQVSRVSPAQETRRHVKFRREAVQRGEIPAQG